MEISSEFSKGLCFSPDAAAKNEDEDGRDEEGYSSQYEDHDEDQMDVDNFDDVDDDDDDDEEIYDTMEDEFEVALEDTINPLLIQDINIMREWWGTESIDFKIFEALDEMEVSLWFIYRCRFC